MSVSCHGICMVGIKMVISHAQQYSLVIGLYCSGVLWVVFDPAEDWLLPQLPIPYIDPLDWNSQASAATTWQDNPINLVGSPTYIIKTYIISKMVRSYPQVTAWPSTCPNLFLSLSTITVLTCKLSRHKNVLMDQALDVAVSILALTSAFSTTSCYTLQLLKSMYAYTCFSLFPCR